MGSTSITPHLKICSSGTFVSLSGAMERRVKAKMPMLKNVSWQEFLLAVMVFTICWYGLIWLLYYRRKKGLPDDPLPHKWQFDVHELDEKDSLLGKPALAEGENVLEAEAFGFAGPDELEQIGVVADAQEDIKLVCRQLDDTSGSKADFLELFRVVKDRYAAALPAESKALLGEFVRERVPFFLSEEELENLWLA